MVGLGGPIPGGFVTAIGLSKRYGIRQDLSRCARQWSAARDTTKWITSVP
jgi:hypothetical protein